jgi:hypothetical protein
MQYLDSEAIVESDTDLLELCALRDARIGGFYLKFLVTALSLQTACSKAIASRRYAVRHPCRLEGWLHAQVPPPPTVAVAAGGDWSTAGDTDGGGWGGDAGGGQWGNGGVWDWDGITVVPKFPGKARRRRRRKAAQRAEAAALAAHFMHLDTECEWGPTCG